MFVISSARLNNGVTDNSIQNAEWVAGCSWRAYAQHQAHIALIMHGACRVSLMGCEYGQPMSLSRFAASWSARDLDAHRIHDRGASIGETVARSRQRHGAAAQYRLCSTQAASRRSRSRCHYRNLIEQILADEERHLSWLDTEIDLHETLESRYIVPVASSGSERA